MTLLDVSFSYFIQQVCSNPALAITTLLTLGVIFVNGWTDAPNAIATCVTTRCLRIRPAVIMAAVLNFFGVFIMTQLNASVASTISNMVDFGGDTNAALIALCAALFSIVVYSVGASLLGIPTYAFNCLVGYVFTIGFAVLLASMGLQDLLASGTVNGVELGAERVAALMGNIQLALPWVLGFCGLTCTSSVPSVSIEGRSAWLMATAPVSTRTMLGAKLASSAIPLAM